MKAQEYREMDLEELEEQLKEKRAELIRQRFDVGSRQLKNYQKPGDTRKEIARILTVVRQMKESSAREAEDKQKEAQ